MKRPFLTLPPALRHRNFALFWLGLLVSVAGSQMQLSALLWHLRDLSDQPVVVSGIGLARFLPILLLAPFGGLAADRFNRRKLLFVTQTCAALVALALGLLTWFGVIRVWHIYVLTALQAVTMSFDLPARQSLVPNLVPRQDMPSAFSLQSIAFNTGAILGPGLSGMVIGYLGQHAVYWINAVSFGAVLLALAVIGPIPQATLQAVGGFREALKSIGEGARFLLGRPVIFSSMILDFIATFFSSATTLLPFVARDILGVDAIGYGWLASAESIGAVSMGVVLSQRTRLRRQGRILLGAVTVYGLATVGFGLAGSFVAAFLALGLLGAGDAVSAIIRNTLRQMQTPDQMRGRMVSLTQIFFQGGPQLGEIEAGLVAQAFGTPVSIISGGLACILGVGLVALIFPQLRRYDGSELPAA